MRRSLILMAMAVIASMTPDVGAQVLASGQATIQPSDGPNHPDFNTAITRQHTIPLTLGSTVGAELSVSLRDVSRPNQMCPALPGPGVLDSGCVTVDWPFFSRRGINLVAFDTTSGPVARHLHLDDTMSPVPEPSNE